MSDALAIYGATGHSGQRVARRACELGLRPILCGRDAAKLATLCDQLGLDHRVARLDDADGLEAAFRDARVVLNAAGPFSRTAVPIVDACLRVGAHYLDLTAEAPVVDGLAGRDGAARRRGIMVMPAVGFDVVPTDCLAVHVARRLPRARRLAIAVTNLFFLTRGSAKTLLEGVDFGAVRRGGVMTRIPLGSLERTFDFGAGPRGSLNVSLADLVTAHYSTGIPDIETYVEGTPLMRTLLKLCGSLGWLLRSGPSQAWLEACAELLPEEPVAGVPQDPTMSIVAEAEDDAGRRARARLRTPEAYAFTGTTASVVAQRAIAGDVEVGFQTPARVYGSDFVLSLPGIAREDLE